MVDDLHRRRNMLKRLLFVLFVVSLTPVAASTASGPYTFLTLDYPGAISTSANGVNDKGHVVGGFETTETTHGFLWKSGQFTVIDVPGALVTEAFGINSKGQIVGVYSSGGFSSRHIFLRDKDGSFTTIAPPNAGTSLIWAYDISDSGDIVGSFWDNVEPGKHGFVWRNGVYTVIDVPGYAFTRVFGGNNAKQLAGTFAADDDIAPRSGFTYAGGVFTPIDEPDAYSGENPPNTWVTNLDDALRVVGYYVGSRPQTTSLGVQSKSPGVRRGRVRPKVGKFDALEQISSASPMLNTLALNSGYHGFVLAGGKFTTLDVPIAVDTFPMASNVQGVIVGYYSDEFGYGHGFIAQR
jgi:probable HAF family extracellular repeat protein